MSMMNIAIIAGVVLLPGRAADPAAQGQGRVARPGTEPWTAAIASASRQEGRTPPRRPEPMPLAAAAGQSSSPAERADGQPCARAGVRRRRAQRRGVAARRRPRARRVGPAGPGGSAARRRAAAGPCRPATRPPWPAPRRLPRPRRLAEDEIVTEPGWPMPGEVDVAWSSPAAEPVGAARGRRPAAQLGRAGRHRRAAGRRCEWPRPSPRSRTSRSGRRPAGPPPRRSRSGPRRSDGRARVAGARRGRARPPGTRPPRSRSGPPSPSPWPSAVAEWVTDEAPADAEDSQVDRASPVDPRGPARGRGRVRPSPTSPSRARALERRDAVAAAEEAFEAPPVPEADEALEPDVPAFEDPRRPRRRPSAGRATSRRRRARRDRR